MFVFQGQRHRDHILVDRWDGRRLRPPNSAHSVSKAAVLLSGTCLCCLYYQHQFPRFKLCSSRFMSRCRQLPSLNNSHTEVVSSTIEVEVVFVNKNDTYSVVVVPSFVSFKSVSWHNNAPGTIRERESLGQNGETAGTVNDINSERKGQKSGNGSNEAGSLKMGSKSRNRMAKNPDIKTGGKKTNTRAKHWEKQIEKHKQLAATRMGGIRRHRENKPGRGGISKTGGKRPKGGSSSQDWTQK